MLKELVEQYLNQYTGGYHHRNAIRYLSKRDEALWRQVFKATNFLPTPAAPKQRIWHILNDIYYRPTCPQTGEFVKWFENRYLKFISQSAKATYQNLHSLTKNQTPRAQAKRTASQIKRVKDGLWVKPKVSANNLKKQAENRLKTFNERYGVSNANDIPGVKQKISNKWIERGATPKHLRSKRKIYYDAVWYYTEKSWRKHFDDINPKRINRSKNALDHIFSVQQGFRENIPPYIIGHYTNLRVITLSENSKKGMRCDKDKEQLFEDFFTSADDKT